LEEQQMTELGIFAQAAAEYGFPFVLSIALLIYVYKKQKGLDAKADIREQQAYDREKDHRQFIESLKDDLCSVARANNEIVTEINNDVDNLHQKIIGMGGELDVIKGDVQTIRKDVTEIKEDVTHINEVVVMRGEKR
jgi:hypothetical protein